MQKLQLGQKITQKLSKQQIQFIKLLQVPTIALNAYISREVAANPLLEDAKLNDDKVASISESEEERDIASVHHQEDSFKRHHKVAVRSSRDAWTPAPISLQEQLKEQLHLLPLREIDYIIGEHLIGSLDQNGYLSCDLEVIVQDLHVMHYLELSLKEVEQVLKVIQHFDPLGVAARNLQECLAIQLQGKNQDDPIILLAQHIVHCCFEEFTKNRYDAILKKIAVSDRVFFKDAITHIKQLNPRPGESNYDIEHTNNYLSPDFVIVEKEGKLAIELTYYPSFKPRFNKTYLKMLDTYEKRTKKDSATVEMVAFLKKKLEDAKWFVEALNQRNQTLLRTMEAILHLQYRFFTEGEEVAKLTPMILQHVADKIHMDTSTVSRIVNQKSVQGKFGIYPLKFFFSEAISSMHGEEVSNKAIKDRIIDLIKDENKQKPYPDETIHRLLMQEGYPVARRTVTKYREQLQIPVARLRKTLI